jgi:hypothetical protein
MEIEVWGENYMGYEHITSLLVVGPEVETVLQNAARFCNKYGHKEPRELVRNLQLRLLISHPGWEITTLPSLNACKTDFRLVIRLHDEGLPICIELEAM